jgi:hypothetical protein
LLLVRQVIDFVKLVFFFFELQNFIQRHYSAQDVHYRQERTKGTQYKVQNNQSRTAATRKEKQQLAGAYKAEGSRSTAKTK